MSPASRRPVWPRLLAWTAAALAVLAALAALALAVLFPPARVRALVTDQLHAALRRDVRFGSASIGLWPPVTLTVEKPELAEPGGFAAGDAFGANSVRLSVDVMALLSRRVKVERFELDEPALHVVLRADGSTNLDSLAAPAQPGAPPPAMDLDVRVFAIRGGRVLLDDERAGRRTAFSVSTTTSLLAELGGQRVATAGTTDLSGLAFGSLAAAREADLDHGLSRLVFHVEHRGKYDAERNRLALERLALTIGRTSLALSGLVDDVGPHARYDVRARGDGLDLRELLAWASVADAQAVRGISGSGSVSFDLAARGAVAAPAGTLPAISGRLAVRNASFRYAAAPVGVEALGLTATFAPDSLTIPDLAARVSGQPVRAELFATRFADPLVRFALQGDIDLAAVGPLVAQQGATLAGRVAVDVRGSGRAKDPGTLALQGRALLTGVSVATKDLPKRIEGVNGTVLLSPQAAQVKQLTARAGQSSYTIDAKITRPLALMARPDSVPPAGVTFDFRSPHLDLAELLPTTPGAPFLPNAKGGGTVHIDRLIQGKLDVTNVVGQVSLAPGQLESPSFSLAGYSGTITGSAKFDLRDTRKPGWAVKANVAGVQANDMLSAWTPAKNLLAGSLNTTLDLSGSGQTPDELKRSLTLTGLAALTQGQLGPGPTLDAVAAFVKVPQLRAVKFRDLKLPMRIEQGRLVTDPVQLSGPSGDWKLSGAIGFDGSIDYAVSVTLPPEVSAALGARSALAAGALTDDQGRMLLDLRVSGSAKSPRVAWDSKAMHDRLAGRASQALADQRAKLEADARAAAQRALAGRLGLARDSTQKAAPPPTLAAARDTLRKAANDLLRNFFNRRSPPDTTRH